MAKADQPFAGLHLSNLPSSTGPSLDQQLFGSPTPAPTPQLDPAVTAPQLTGANQETTVARNQDAKAERRQPVSRAPKQPSNQDTTPPGDQEIGMETIRLAVKELGRIAGTHRYTAEEKRALEELVYHYGQRGVKTSGNEIIRIGLNYLLEDYRLRGRSSILARVLDRLNA